MWEEIIGGKLPNATFRATLSGFADPDQRSLTEQFRDQYFAVLADVWREWSSDMAQRFVAIAYTICPVSAETIRVTDDYIAQAQPPRRCAACSSKAATTWPVPSAAATATPSPTDARRPRPGGGLPGTRGHPGDLGSVPRGDLGSVFRHMLGRRCPQIRGLGGRWRAGGGPRVSRTARTTISSRRRMCSWPSGAGQ